MNISQDKQRLLKIIAPGNAYIVTGEAGTGKTFAGVLCGARLLNDRPKWQRVLYLTYSKLAKWQIIETAERLVSDGLVNRETLARMDIQNYHSWWWDIISKHHAFLGIHPLPRLWPIGELRRLVKGELDRLSREERLNIVPVQFLRQSDQGLNENKRGRLETALSGSALLYAKWGCEHYGEDAKDFTTGGDRFIPWASNQIETRNRHGVFSHDETVWWAYKLLETHPTAANLMKAICPVVILDEFQDIDISQWQTVELISPETVIVMGDTKQTIHRWRGADPEHRFVDLKAFCRDKGKYSSIVEFELTDRNRSTRDMSLGDYHETKTVEPGGEERVTKQRVLGCCKSSVIAGLKRRDGVIGVMCVSNELADATCTYLRQTQRRNDDGKVFGPRIRCARLGASNSPFEAARELLLGAAEREADADATWSYLANDVAWRIMGLGQSRMPICGEKSRNEEPVLRRDSAKGIAQVMGKDFGQGLLRIRDFVFALEQYHECCSEVLPVVKPNS